MRQTCATAAGQYDAGAAWASKWHGFLLCVLGLAISIGDGFAAEDSASSSSPEPRGASHAHEMSQSKYDALREKVPLYRNYTDAEIDLSMLMMGPNYAASVSGPDVSADVGVLVLAHGFGEVGDRVFKEQLESIGSIFPTAIGFGMSMMNSAHIQLAVDDLVAAGAQTIVVIPALSSPWNTQMRQWEYMFGIHDNAGYLETERITTSAGIIFSDTLSDNPLVAEALLDYANELKAEPARTVVIIVSHGPTSEDDNQKTLQMLHSLGDIVREDGRFREVKAISLQNDAPKDVRAANVVKLRNWVASGAEQGDEVVIVTNLLATRSIQNQIREELAGLQYKFNAKGLSQHPNFNKWIEDSVRKRLSGTSIQED